MQHIKTLRPLRLRWLPFQDGRLKVIGKTGRKQIELKWMLLWVVLATLALYGVAPAMAANWYVDKDAQGSNNGTSWNNAWNSLNRISGVSAGDTVYISGGSTSKTYTLSSSWSPSAGTSGHPITYKVGQDSGHNGTVIIDGNNSASNCIALSNYTTIDGEVSGSRHMTLQNSTSNQINAVSRTGVKIAYITVSSDIVFNAATFYEISHCYLVGENDVAISFSDASPSDLGWGANSIHDNYFQLNQANDASGYGTDGLQWVNCADIYNNQFIGTETGYSGGQHQDGIQTDNYKNRIYNNLFRDLGNYPIFIDAFKNITNLRIYNNVIEYTNSKWSGGLQQAIAVGRDGGAAGTLYFTNVIVGNNTCCNVADKCIATIENALQVWDSSSVFYNNISIGGVWGSNNIPPSATGYGSATNKRVTTGGTNIFVDYRALGNGTSDLHLKSADTVLKDQGTSMPSYFTTDKDGISRPQGSAWDIGAYEYRGGPPAPTGVRVIQQNP
jgi:hypothetical protein